MTRNTFAQPAATISALRAKSKPLMEHKKAEGGRSGNINGMQMFNPNQKTHSHNRSKTHLPSRLTTNETVVAGAAKPSPLNKYTMKTQNSGDGSKKANITVPVALILGPENLPFRTTELSSPAKDSDDKRSNSFLQSPKLSSKILDKKRLADTGNSFQKPVLSHMRVQI